MTVTSAGTHDAALRRGNSVANRRTAPAQWKHERSPATVPADGERSTAARISGAQCSRQGGAGRQAPE
ncbi:hypothetical protein DY218_29005 [Streptomyces triticagri]|uniref:Uncharacterized protein n=1 Tax=Streptomyces triticagri TaxID=2293568 RepID=A0A372LXC7_9ACTN|nr:hypothetical protein DY218_29005 [Streptomyces triticagri]